MKLGDVVSWTSSAAGTTKTKRGVIVAVVPTWRDVHRWLSLDSLLGQEYEARYRLMTDFKQRLVPRDEISFLVTVPSKSGRGKPRLYWPRVSALRLVEDTGAVKCCIPPSLPPAENAAELRELGLTAESEMQPTALELKVELEMGRMSYQEYKAECQRYGHRL